MMVGVINFTGFSDTAFNSHHDIDAHRQGGQYKFVGNLKMMLCSLVLPPCEIPYVTLLKLA